MLYKTKPEKFNPKFEAAGCFMEFDGKILLLHRHDHKSEGNKWGLPCGKIEDSESALKGMLREISEETSCVLKENDLVYHGEFYVRYDEYDFLYHIFSTKLTQEPKIELSISEHKDHMWEHPLKALSLNLVKDTDACIGVVYKDM